MSRRFKKGIAAAVIAVSFACWSASTFAQYQYNSADITLNPVVPTDNTPGALIYSQSFNAMALTTAAPGTWPGALRPEFSGSVGTLPAPAGTQPSFGIGTAPGAAGGAYGWQVAGNQYSQSGFPGYLTTPTPNNPAGMVLNVNFPGAGNYSVSGRLVIGGNWGGDNGLRSTDALNFQLTTASGSVRPFFSETFHKNNLSLMTADSNPNLSLQGGAFQSGLNAGDRADFLAAGQFNPSGLTPNADFSNVYNFNFNIFVPEAGNVRFDLFGSGGYTGTTVNAGGQVTNVEFFGIEDLQIQSVISPEPSSIALLGLALAGVGVAGWRRHRRRTAA